MTNEDKGFAISGGHGFQITFNNGYTVSVQFGKMHYCANRKDDPRPADMMDETPQRSQDAECAVIYGGSILDYFDDGSVRGWMTPNAVAALITEVSALEAKGGA